MNEYSCVVVWEGGEKRNFHFSKYFRVLLIHYWVYFCVFIKKGFTLYLPLSKLPQSSHNPLCFGFIHSIFFSDCQVPHLYAHTHTCKHNMSPIKILNNRKVFFVWVLFRFLFISFIQFISFFTILQRHFYVWIVSFFCFVFSFVVVVLSFIEWV